MTDTLIALLSKVKSKLDKAMEAFKGTATHPAFNFVQDAHEDILIYLSDPDNQREISVVDDKQVAQAIARYFAGHAYNQDEYQQCLGCVDAIRPYLREPKRESGKHDGLAAIKKCLVFFASVIKSGEPWTETCQREYDKAMNNAGSEKLQHTYELARQQAYADNNEPQQSYWEGALR